MSRALYIVDPDNFQEKWPDAKIQPTTVIRSDVKLGKGVKIWHNCNIYGSEIGDETSIGSMCEVRGQVKIGRRCKVEAFVFIPEGVIIEDEVFIGPHVSFTNDKNPHATNPDGSLMGQADWVIERTLVRKRVSIGANATILPGLTIGEGAVIGAGSVVTKDVVAGTVVVGNPAKTLKIK